MAAQQDFWGELQQVQFRTPVAILKEQVALLGQKTGHLVSAKVVSETRGSTFIHRFALVVPALDEYSYELFLIQHGVDLYPVTGFLGSDPVLRAEAEFANWLRETLSPAETKRIISNLLAQVNS